MLKHLLFLVTGLIFIIQSCSVPEINSDEGIECIERFFAHVAANDHSSAADLIDTQSSLYQKRHSKISALGNDSILGSLILAEKPKLLAITSTSTANYSTVELPFRLQYDSSYRMVQVRAVDRGKGYRVNSIELK